MLTRLTGSDSIGFVSFLSAPRCNATPWLSSAITHLDDSISSRVSETGFRVNSALGYLVLAQRLFPLAWLQRGCVPLCLLRVCNVKPILHGHTLSRI